MACVGSIGGEKSLLEVGRSLRDDNGQHGRSGQLLLLNIAPSTNEITVKAQVALSHCHQRTSLYFCVQAQYCK